jgi:H+/gluconate symporter-like permease
MKAVLTLSHRSHIKPSAVYHHAWDSVHTEKMIRLAEKTMSASLAVIVITGATSLFATIVSQLGGREIIADYSQAMSKVVWMGFF